MEPSTEQRCITKRSHIYLDINALVEKQNKLKQIGIQGSFI